MVKSWLELSSDNFFSFHYQVKYYLTFFDYLAINSTEIKVGVQRLPNKRR